MAMAGLWRGGWSALIGEWRLPLTRLLTARVGARAESRWQDDTTDATQQARLAMSASSDTPTQEFEIFFREHERAVYGCLWRLTGDPQAARDLTQETFLRAWRHFERVRGYEQPRAWLLRVATNLARTAYRHERGRPLSSDALTDADAPARSDPTHRLAERDLVERTLLELPPNQRAALTLREVYGYSCEEIGAMLGLSRDAAKMALFRGREAFRRRYLGKEATGE